MDAIATRVVSLLNERPCRYLDTATVARTLAVSEQWVRDHAAQLGAVRLGDQPGAPLRFDQRRVQQTLDGWRIGQPQPRGRRRRPGPPRRAHGVDLLPLPEGVAVDRRHPGSCDRPSPAVPTQGRVCAAAARGRERPAHRGDRGDAMTFVWMDGTIYDPEIGGYRQATDEEVRQNAAEQDGGCDCCGAAGPTTYFDEPADSDLCPPCAAALTEEES